MRGPDTSSLRLLLQSICSHNMRPDRSDTHISPEEEAKKEEETREYFEEIAPKRHTKPSRSEYSTVYSDNLTPSDQVSIPELDKLHSLEANDQQVYICFLLLFVSSIHLLDKYNFWRSLQVETGL